MADPAILTHSLTKKYGAVTAVHEMDLEVKTGEVFGFLGPNGAGKSTTIRTLLDQIRPTVGSATILGLDSHTDSLAIRRRVGYVPGDLALYPNLTGRETIRYFARLRGGVEQAVVDELAQRLQADLTKKVKDYSTGNRQKIGLIQAFMHRPELLILDEPNAGLDPLMQQEFLTLLAEARERGSTVFLSSHTLSEVERIADRVGIIRDGRLIVVERIDDLKRKAVRRLDFEFAQPLAADTFAGVTGVREVTVDGTHVHISYEGPVTDVLRAATTYEVLNLTSREEDLEEIFLAYYRGDEADAVGEASASQAESTNHVR
ncbi:ABC transporter ATP-binding protein [Glaciibacter psychrotolerans]|uniref:ABC-2 type transport system ATP-binding protein n=1 Tax=Glaciibacter psychrotolerans TaxID=670054 RepID=A0A7Z0ED12_9MICO|nr:ABC transporter ATP-binding protein [Leifsonia psychrotolerans]NYJ19228.1 ABC-2 type transport system ATP-binding protein [Leifsonia psychrotolerans]